MTIPPELQEVVDTHRIYAVLTRYCRALDRCDIELFKEVYWPDGTDDHGVFKGNAHEFAEFMVGLARKFYLATQHSISNVSYEIDGDEARTESYLIAYHRISTDPDIVREVFGNTYLEQHRNSGAKSHDYVHGGRYLDRLTRRKGVWRIASRIVTMEWNIMQPGSFISTEGHVSSLTAIGTRDRTDPAYRR